MLISILFILSNFNSELLSQEDSYEVKLFINEDYLSNRNSILLKSFQSELKFKKLNYTWYIVNINASKYDDLFKKGEFDGFNYVALDKSNKISKLYDIKTFPTLVLLKNNKLLYKTNNFIFNNISEVIDFDKYTKIIDIDTTLIDVKDMIIVGENKYILDDKKNQIYKLEVDKYIKIDFKSIIEKEFDLEVFGNINFQKLYLVNYEPLALIKFNTIKEGGKLTYYEMIINLANSEVYNYKYDKNTYILSDNLMPFCDNIVYPCFHLDYYGTTNKDTIKMQPILATISKTNDVKYHSSIAEIEEILNNEFKYLYVLNSFSSKNNIILFEPSLGLSIVTKYNCENNSIEKFLPFNFENPEAKRIFENLKLDDPYGQDLSSKSDYYFEGIKNVDGSNFALVFRSKLKDQFGTIEYILYEYTENLYFSKKKTFVIMHKDKNDKILNTFLIPNADNKILIGIKSENKVFKIYEPKI